MSAQFIVFEGGEGAGKSTAAAAVAEALRADGHEVVLTREPGGTPAGELIRGLLHEELSPWTEAFAFFTARAELVATVIRPALERGATVICDRFQLSTFAYQGHARGLDLDALRAANTIATGGLAPNLTVLFDLDPSVGMARKLGETEAIRTGMEGLAFHELVRAGYRSLLEEEPGGHIVVDAARPADEVAGAVLSAIRERELGVRS